MSKAFVIEIGSEAAGLVVQDGRYFQFFASVREFHDLEGRTFRSVAAAHRAALAHRAESSRKGGQGQIAA